MLAQFGTKLTYLRERQSLTQADLTRLLDIRRAHVSNLEAGRRAPSLDLVIRIATLFHVSVDYLVRDDVPAEEVPGPVQWPATSIVRPGSQVRALRLKRGLRQAELAAALGIQTQAHISLVESGQKEPSIGLLLTIANYFGVSIDEVVFGLRPEDFEEAAG